METPENTRFQRPEGLYYPLEQSDLVDLSTDTEPLSAHELYHNLTDNLICEFAMWKKKLFLKYYALNYMSDSPASSIERILLYQRLAIVLSQLALVRRTL